MPWTVSSLLFIPLLFAFTLGCGRFPATPPPTTTTVEPPTTDSGVNTLHLPCTEAEDNATACRYGGECFVLEIGGIRSAQCKCPKGYLPPRCNELDPSVFWNDYQRPDRVASAGIAASVVAVVLFVTVLVCIVIWRRRYLRKKNAKPTENGKNGSLINDQDTTDMDHKEIPPGDEEYNRYHLSDHFPVHRNSSATPLASAPPPPPPPYGANSDLHRPNSYDSYHSEHYPPNDQRSSKFDPYPDISFADEDETLKASGEKLLYQNSSSVVT